MKIELVPLVTQSFGPNLFLKVTLGTIWIETDSQSHATITGMYGCTLEPGSVSEMHDLVFADEMYRRWPSVDEDDVPNGSCTMHPECDAAYKTSYRETFHKGDFVRGKTYERRLAGAIESAQ